MTLLLSPLRVGICFSIPRVNPQLPYKHHLKRWTQLYCVIIKSGENDSQRETGTSSGQTDKAEQIWQLGFIETKTSLEHGHDVMSASRNTLLYISSHIKKSENHLLNTIR